MTEQDTMVEQFPREQYLELLRLAQHLLATQDARKELWSDLGLSVEFPNAAPREVTVEPSGDPRSSRETLAPNQNRVLGTVGRALTAPREVTVEPSGDPRSSRETLAPNQNRVLGTVGSFGEYASTARFASRLVDELATPQRLNQSITLARRIARLVPESSSLADALVAKLRALYHSQRVLAVQDGDSPNLEGYQRWLGFECAHEYSLADRFFGRQAQLQELDDWVASPSEGSAVHCICALGGSGKSALAWHWLEQTLPRLRQRNFQGAFWCSFYEKNFSFERFLDRLLGWGGQTSREDLQKLTRAEKEAKLLASLKNARLVVVLDGLERLMNGYAVSFDRAVDPDSVQGGKREDQLSSYDRRLTDLRDGAFLSRLATELTSKVLITSRLRPADLERSGTQEPLPHTSFTTLRGLDLPDLAALWHSIVPDCPLTEELSAIFHLSGNHPLVVSILARSVVKAGGWQSWKDNPAHRAFKPSETASEAEARAHMIGTCMRDLPESAYDVLGVLTTSGKPMPLRLIAQVLLRGSAESGDDRWHSEEQVRAELDELVSLGLVGLAEQTEPPEYDVHPVVRGATWSLITDGGRQRFLTHALSEFLATPDQRAPDEGLELNKATSLMRLLVQSGQVDRAWEMYFNKLYWPLLQRSENRTLLDLFALLLPNGNVFQLLPVESRTEQGNATHTLGSLLMEEGDGRRSDKLLRWAGAIRLQLADFQGFLEARRTRTWQTLYEGKLYETECTLRRMKLEAINALALEIVPSINVWIGIALALRGKEQEARSYFAAGMMHNLEFRWWAQSTAEGWVYVGDPEKAIDLLDRLNAWEPADGMHQLAWEQLTRGMALFHKPDYAAAWDQLAECLQSASRSGYLIIQCFALPYIAEIQLERGDAVGALERLERYSELDPRDHYKLSAADVWRVRARCHLAIGDSAAARESAARAYTLAACDGPPFTYLSALKRARQTLEECGGYVPTTMSTVDPAWRDELEQLLEAERGLQQALREAQRAHETGNGDVARPLTTAQAHEVLREPAVLQGAAEQDHAWWAETTSAAPAVFKQHLADAMSAGGITLERFRHAFETSEHKSLEVVFHELHAENLVSPETPRPVRSLTQEDKRNWLTAVDEHARGVDNFLKTEFATHVGYGFELHEFDNDGVTAFLNDNKRRLCYEAAGEAKIWWDQLEGNRPAEALLILSQCIVFEGVTLDEFLDEIATGTDHGIEYAFVALRIKRSLERLKVTEPSKTEGWSETQVLLRLQDVKRLLSAQDASAEAVRFWSSLEEKNSPRRVLQLAEELARRGSSLQGYYEAYLFSNSDNIQANLAYIDYTRLKDQDWQPPAPWPSIATLDNRVNRATDTSTWAPQRLASRLNALLERVGLTDASDDAQRWWQALAAELPDSLLLHVAEELSARMARIEELYRATIDGDTKSLPAAIAYLEVSRTKRNEISQATQKATALNRQGNTHYSNGEFAEAIESYEAAIREVPTDAVFYTNLADAWLARKDYDEAGAYKAAEAALRRGLENSSTRSEIEKHLKGLQIRRRLAERGGLPKLGQSAVMIPVVTPIVLEVASNLIELYERNDGPGMTGIASVRTRIRDKMGVSVPGIRVRGNETDLRDNTYIVMVDEVPLVLGQVRANQCFAKASPEKQRRLGLIVENAIDPLDDSEGVWVAIEDAGLLSEPCLTPSEYIARHLEGVLLNHLTVFSGHEEVLARLAHSWSSEARIISANKGLLTAYTRSLCALLRELVSTVEFEVLCEGFLEHWPKTKHLDKTVAALRLLPAIRHTLPGNQASSTLWKLGLEMEKILLAGLHEYGDAHVLVLEPEVTQDILSAVRQSVSGEAPVLVTDHPMLRPYVRRVVELEFPRLHVMTTSELNAGRREIIQLRVEL